MEEVVKETIQTASENNLWALVGVALMFYMGISLVDKGIAFFKWWTGRKDKEDYNRRLTDSEEKWTELATSLTSAITTMEDMSKSFQEDKEMLEKSMKQRKLENSKTIELKEREIALLEGTNLIKEEAWKKQMITLTNAVTPLLNSEEIKKDISNEVVEVFNGSIKTLQKDLKIVKRKVEILENNK